MNERGALLGHPSSSKFCDNDSSIAHSNSEYTGIHS